MSERQFIEECLSVTNSYRAIHQAAPLSYNRGLEQVAKQWADYLTKTNKWEHNPNAKYQGKQLGENIASHWSSNKDANYSASHAVAQWYNEIERYNFRSHQGPNTGHFTQLVWRGSKEVGVGRSQSKDGTWIAVANYLPPGNVIGEYPQNVLPPRDGKRPVPTPRDDGIRTPRQHDAHARLMTPPPRPHDAHARIMTPPPRPHDAHARIMTPPPTPTPHTSYAAASKNANSFRKAVRTEVRGDVTTVTTTETAKTSDGVTAVKVTEKVSRPGQLTRVKVTETVTAPDGRQRTKTMETTEK